MLSTIKLFIFLSAIILIYFWYTAEKIIEDKFIIFTYKG